MTDSSAADAAEPTPDELRAAFFALHADLPRQGPGSDATTRRMLDLAGPLPERPRVLDVGCGPGRSALLLAAEAGARVTAIDVHQPFLDALTAAAAERGLADRVTAENRSMDDLPWPDGTFDVVWAEGSAFVMGFERALRSWRRLLAPGGVLVVTDCEWTTDTPSPEARAFWDAAYPLRTREENTAVAREAGYRVRAARLQPDSDWWPEYYEPLEARAEAADTSVPGMAEAVAGARAEIALRRDHGGEYGYTAFVLRPEGEPTATGD
ncbi:cyclopropane-fatty-acyl-phospholipid synthase family protein [Nocardiopsis sp. FIRDI 009]|uniref:SAM-dependent methyltransferase n=1 Tax=Nocardiopsis sp. FIRDI 009 TaxID=714197 RepID=UPI000E273DC1|nr:class I SAM-dependent methyltransferase [Nocardiopsis sp. FIRDI 009]